MNYMTIFFFYPFISERTFINSYGNNFFDLHVGDIVGKGC